MFNISNINGWFEFLEITYLDIILFVCLFSLILLGIYIAIKKDIFLGIFQIFLTFFTPYLILRLFNEYKPYWEIPKKRWVMTFASDFTGDASSLWLVLFIFIPLFIYVTAKSILLIYNQKTNSSIE